MCEKKGRMVFCAEENEMRRSNKGRNNTHRESRRGWCQEEKRWGRRGGKKRRGNEERKRREGVPPWMTEEGVSAEAKWQTEPESVFLQTDLQRQKLDELKCQSSVQQQFSYQHWNLQQSQRFTVRILHNKSPLFRTYYHQSVTEVLKVKEVCLE